MNLFKIEAGTAQHIGNRPRQNDRVALLTGARAPGYLLAVLSDGLNGPSAADQVLHTAKLIFDEFKPSDTANPERLAQLLRDIVHETHLVVQINAVTAGEETHASFVGLVISPHGEAVWAHVGDSRLYRFENGEPKLRTNDQAYIEHLVALDKLPLEAARNHRRSKLLVNAVGNSRKEPYVTVGWQMGMAPGDQFLLCSDGLWHFFTDAELGAALARSTPRLAAEKLINKAAERSQGKGGNCSMAIVKLVKPVQEFAPI
ncbi:serine/threonine-protein phosphatase [Massilia sp. Dwa41.01b]|uniref:PP2C family protein-serine/threonine phosphatase n=1 Tax=unclassified Massilia TaxID=2609279 RepID=UPI001603E232|nr:MULTISPECIES: protein phosphatase 2C domain-containing protein [unclassified Massilia]QNA89806.1 serine/threonine-protein phosphatase [Massilia sp. Dwa41.01b]QNB00702.1 serine/threonine-protein phosphatase [Massilia sp. Se16.2.3]